MQRAEIAAFAPGVARLGVVVGIVKPPPSDPTLARLPRRVQDVDGAITINVAGLRPSQPAGTRAASQPPQPIRQPFQPAASRAALPGFTRAAHGHQPMTMPANGQRLLTALDPIIHLGAHIPGDRRGLGRYPSPPPGPVPPHARDVQPMEADGPESPLVTQPQPPAPPAAMDVDPRPAPSAPLPDVPLVDPLLEWLVDEDQNSLPRARLRLQVLAFRDQYPSLWQRHAQNASYPPHPEVRTAAAGSILQPAPESALPAQDQQIAVQPAPPLPAQIQPPAAQPAPAAPRVEQGATDAPVRVPSESGGNAGRNQSVGRGGVRSVAPPRAPRSPPHRSSPSPSTVADRQGRPARDSGGTGRGGTSTAPGRGRGGGAAGRGSGRPLVRTGALGPIAPPPPSPIPPSPSQPPRSAPFEGPASAARRRHQSQDRSVSQHAWHHPARLPTSQSFPSPPGPSRRATQ